MFFFLLRSENGIFSLENIIILGRIFGRIPIYYYNYATCVS